MAFFKRKKRTTKSVGQAIGRSIARQKQQEKVLRTLQKEDEQREKERKINRKIKELKQRRPTLLKKVVSGSSNVAKRIQASNKRRVAQMKKQATNRGKRVTKTKQTLPQPSIRDLI